MRTDFASSNVIRTHSRSSALVLTLAAFIAAGSADAAPPRFGVQALPPLSGGTATAANDINDAGQVVGTSNTSGTGYPSAVTWINGNVIYITGSGVSGASANGINDAGMVVGISDTLGLNAFIWHNGVVSPLPVEHPCCSVATAVNDHADAVGFASLAGVNTPNDGVLWAGSKLVPLGTLGGTLAHARDINNAGQIVGMSDVSNNGEYFPFIWHDGVMTPLPAGGGAFGSAEAINDSGLIVGSYQPGTFGQRAAKWVGGELVPLPSLGGALSMAADVNSIGWIVGYAMTSSSSSSGTAALWIDDQPFDLNRRSLIGEGDGLWDARGVNSLGQIVGEGVFDGEIRGWVLTPLSAGDVNGDFAVNVQDLLSVIGQWGACPAPVALATCSADLDGTGVVDVTDLLEVISHWR